MLIAYKYHHVFVINTDLNTVPKPGRTNFQYTKKAGSNGTLTKTVDYIISSDGTTGIPHITYINPTASDILLDYQRVLYSECQRRILPVL